MPTNKETELELLQLFRQCSHLQFHRFNKFHGQGYIISILSKNNGIITQRELCEKTQRRAATLSEQLEQMSQNGIITRQKNKDDKRNIDISLTEKGMAVAQEVQLEREHTAEIIFGNLDSTEKSQLKLLLSKIHSNLTKYNPDEAESEADEK